MKALGLGFVVLAVAAGGMVALLLPDIQRYLKMRAM